MKNCFNCDWLFLKTIEDPLPFWANYVEYRISCVFYPHHMAYKLKTLNNNHCPHWTKSVVPHSEKVEDWQDDHLSDIEKLELTLEGWVS